MQMEHDSDDKYSYGECRCCLAKGKHRDLLQEYYHNGVREVYRDIIMETLNLSLSTAKDLTTLMCTRCISRLRDAHAFRALTVRTERDLLDVIKRNMEFVDVSVGEESAEMDVKWEIKVKQEISDDLVPEHAYDSDNLSSHDYVESPSLVRGESALLARFSAAPRLPTRAGLARALPTFVRHLEMLKQVRVSARSISASLSLSRARPAGGGGEKAAHAHNATTLIRYSNMTPFRSKNNGGFPCFYCRTTFGNFPSLKEHTGEHKHTELARVFKYFGSESLIVYADITGLACGLCGQDTPTIAELTDHLARRHDKTLVRSVGQRVIPFLIGDHFLCPLCYSRYETFGSIERHMNGHFRNYVCKICGSGYATLYRLKVHHKSMHVSGTFACTLCHKIFPTAQKRTNHCNAVHNLKKRFKCSQCSERFAEYFRRQKHMVETHGSKPLRYECNVCERSFDRRYTLSRHLKRDHLEERENVCHVCDYRCFTKNELKVHMVKHTGERIFECAVCKKSYARKKTLKEHMRIHNNDRRFVCPACGQAFVQKCSLKGHMKTHHFEYSLP